MKIWLLIITIVILYGPCFGDTIYTWTDQDGVVHITDKQPPSGTEVTSRLEYDIQEPRRSEVSESAMTDTPTVKDRLILSAAQRRAEAARSNAGAAWKRADEAMEDALKIKKETDEYISKVIHKSRKQKSLRIKIQKKVEASNQAMVTAEELRTAAMEADQAAKVAEREVEMLKSRRESVPEQEAMAPSAD